jgi:hypothetical protein
MVKLPWPSNDDVLLALTWSWVDVLAQGDYEKVFRDIGFARTFGRGAEGIRQEIERYRDDVYFPGETEFHVTDRRAAKSGNPDPLVRVQRFVPSESLPLVAAVLIHLPLNGRWSRLEAHFVAFLDKDAKEAAVFSLEDFWGPQDERWLEK